MDLQFRCPDCSESCDGIDDFVSHLKSRHHGPGGAKCRQCSEWLITDRDSHDHVHQGTRFTTLNVFQQCLPHPASRRDYSTSRSVTIDKTYFQRFIMAILRHYKKISIGLLQSYLKHRWGLPKSDDYPGAMGHPDLRLWQYLQRQNWLICEKGFGEPTLTLAKGSDERKESHAVVARGLDANSLLDFTSGLVGSNKKSGKSSFEDTSVTKSKKRKRSDEEDDTNSRSRSPARSVSPPPRKSRARSPSPRGRRSRSHSRSKSRSRSPKRRHPSSSPPKSVKKSKSPLKKTESARASSSSRYRSRSRSRSPSPPPIRGSHPNSVSYTRVDSLLPSKKRRRMSPSHSPSPQPQRVVSTKPSKVSREEPSTPKTAKPAPEPQKFRLETVSVAAAVSRPTQIQHLSTMPAHPDPPLDTPTQPAQALSFNAILGRMYNLIDTIREEEHLAAHCLQLATGVITVGNEGEGD